VKSFIATLVPIPEIEPPRYVGIYFLLDGDEIVYVGQSTNVLGRIPAHRARRNHKHERHRMQWDRAAWLPLAEHDLDAYEGALIRRLTPRYNAGAPSDTTRDVEICDALNLPAPDLARLAVFLERRHEAYTLPGQRRSEWRQARNKERKRFEKKFGFWTEKWDVRNRRSAARRLWTAAKSLLDGASL
jgi:hypothetical protein